MAESKKPSTPTWHQLAEPTTRKRALWERGRKRTDWAACGHRWDAVSITPIDTGLDALAAMRIGIRRGYLVLADHVRDVLYVMVPAGSGGACADITGVRVLTNGHQLLVPATPQDGTAVADWVSHPREDEPPVLVPADRLAAHLQELTSPVHEKAAVS